VAPSHVLVPLDGSPLAEAALAHALDVFDCRVTVLNVVTPLGADMSESGLRERDDERIAEARERAERAVAQARADDPIPERTVETVVETGQPAETILQYVDDHGVEQVVMGSHGDTQIEPLRRLLGTVATTVVTEASVPVTVVR
jgi:nucleotide-binding universal stress UspA family protein